METGWAEEAECRRKRNRSGRTGAGLFARREGERISREDLVRRAQVLPALPRALITAYFDRGVAVKELAVLHKLPRQTLYQRLMHWQDVLSDPSFMLAAHFAGRLRPGLAELARDHWIKGETLRKLAWRRHTTLHEVRTRLAEARVELRAAAAEMRVEKERELEKALGV